MCDLEIVPVGLAWFRSADRGVAVIEEFQGHDLRSADRVDRHPLRGRRDFARLSNGAPLKPDKHLVAGFLEPSCNDRGTRLSAPEEAVEETLELVAPLERTAFGEAGSPGQTSASSAQKPGSGAWPALNSSKVCRTSSMFSLDTGRPVSRTRPPTPAQAQTWRMVGSATRPARERRSSGRTATPADAVDGGSSRVATRTRLLPAGKAGVRGEPDETNGSRPRRKRTHLSAGA